MTEQSPTQIQQLFDNHGYIGVDVQYIVKQHRGKHFHYFVFPKTYNFTLTRDDYEHIKQVNFMTLLSGQPGHHPGHPHARILRFSKVDPKHKLAQDVQIYDPSAEELVAWDKWQQIFTTKKKQD